MNKKNLCYINTTQIIQKTALFVSKNDAIFIQRIKKEKKGDLFFSFLNTCDIFHKKFQCLLYKKKLYVFTIYGYIEIKLFNRYMLGIYFIIF